jgi:hypothetical protein
MCSHAWDQDAAHNLPVAADARGWGGMPSRASKDRHLVTVARRVVDHAIGEPLDATLLEDPDAGKNPAADRRRASIF